MATPGGGDTVGRRGVDAALGVGIRRTAARRRHSGHRRVRGGGRSAASDRHPRVAWECSEMTTTAGVIATFNQQDYILEAVASLVGYVDEIIVIDDASNDATGDLLDRMSYDNLRV